MTQERIANLIADFVATTKKHHEATKQGHWQETNKYAKHISRIFREIAKIGDIARQALLEEVDNNDLVVASMAATYSLKYATERSLAALRRIAREPGVIGFGAQQALMRWEEGDWQLE